MVALITDPSLEKQLIAQRQATGADKYDEAWEGVYVMAPLANDEHQNLVNELATVLTIVVGWAGLGKVRPGVNVSDRRKDWKENYRCPDVVVFLKDTQAENCGTHWYGGPDFAIEVISPGDRTLEKLPFYAKVAARELMVIDRNPWSIRLFRLRDDQLVEVGSSSLQQSHVLSSEVVPLSFRLLSVEQQPAIEIRHQDSAEKWLVRTAVGLPD